MGDLRDRRLDLSMTIFCLPALVMSVVGFQYNDPMYGSFILAIPAAFLVSKSLLRRFPANIATVWRRGILVPRFRPPGSAADHAGTSPEGDQPLADFLRLTASRFHSRWQLAPGFAFLPVVFAWRFCFARNKEGNAIFVPPYTDMPIDPTSWIALAINVAAFAAECAMAFVLGLVAWRLLVIAKHIREIGLHFDMSPQPVHPDGCGGLRPIGDLCLLNAFLIAIPGLIIATWLVLSPAPYVRERYGDVYKILHFLVLFIPILLSLVAFLIPLWRIHEAMSSGKDAALRAIDTLCDTIGRKISSILPGLDPPVPDVVEQISRDLKSLREINQEVYRIGRRYPVWPFNTGILLKLGLSLSPQLLGLLGFGGPLQKILDALCGWLTPLL